MKVLFDHQIFVWQNYGGISRYFCELMSRFSHSPGLDFRVALRYSQNENLRQNSQLNRFWTKRNDFFSDSLVLSRLQKQIHLNVLNHVFSNQRESVIHLKKENFDIFHPTYYNPYFLPYLKKRPSVLTIYDMIHEKFPDDFDPLTRKRKKILADNASQIIAISENTKADIMNYLNIPENKIHVTYLATSLSPNKRGYNEITADTQQLPAHYLLFVGNRPGYKNFAFLIESLLPIFKANANLSLVCSGGGQFSKAEVKLLRSRNLVSRIHYFPADDITLRRLYTHALAFIFPSLYEGFGIPVLEAFSCGCPVLVSNTSSLPEVAGDAAIYFDPLDKQSLTYQIERILSDDSLRESLIENGFKRSKLFSWEKTAAATKKVYDMALSG
jgi:glycosyltransferase involved in cell wall biosynthesis